MKTYERLHVDAIRAHIGETLFIAGSDTLCLSKLNAVTSYGNFIFDDFVEVLRRELLDDQIRIYKSISETET